MGAGWSDVFGEPSNRSTRNILNVVLKRLITETDMRDMYGLADPEICKKFVVFGAKAFDKLFMKIKINRKPDGTLFFQQLQGLQEHNPDREEQKKNCELLASFYVTIFKIFAALFISIYESNLPLTEISEVRYPTSSRRGAQFYDPQTQAFKGFSKETGFMLGQAGLMRPVMRGGALPAHTGTPEHNFYLTEAAGPYKALNLYLTLPSGADIMKNDINLIVDKRYSNNYEMYFREEDMYNPPALDISGNPTTRRHVKIEIIANGVPFTCSIPTNNGGQEFNARLHLREESGRLIISISNIQAGDDTKIEAFSRQGVVNASGFLMVDKEHFTQYILRTLIETYNAKNKVEFNALNFLQLHDVLRGNEIKDSDFTVLEREGDEPTMLQVRYQPSETMRVSANGSKVKIWVKMNMEITSIKTSERAAKRYNVRLYLKNVTTSPSELEDAFRIYDTYTSDGGYRSSVFTTGSTDTEEPRQEASLRSTIGGFLQRTILEVLNRRDRATDVAPYTVRSELGYRQGVPEPYNSSRMQEEFRIKETWKALARDPPVRPHCMSRALQLLNLAAINGVSSTGSSRVCATKFVLVKDGSLPTPGQPITTSEGIRALAMLFSNVMDKSASTISGSEQYKKFAMKFKQTFEKYGAEVEVTDVPNDIKGVRDKLMPFCNGKLDQDIVLDRSLTSQLRSKVNTLRNMQGRHVSRAMYILFKLFDERALRAGSFEISDYVWRDGTDALSKIVVETRELLMEYYTGCEEEYKAGLTILYNKYKEPAGTQ